MNNFYKVVLVQTKRPFLKNPDHWMSVLAFAVVLATFVINDGLHDRAKELADSQDVAYRAWSNDLSSMRLDALVSYIARATDDLCTTVHKSASPCEKLKTLQDNETLKTDPSAEALEREQSYLLYTISLQQKIPYNQGLDEKHWMLIQAINLQIDEHNLQTRMDFFLKVQQPDRAKQIRESAGPMLKEVRENSEELQKEFSLPLMYNDLPEMQLSMAINSYSKAVVEQVRVEHEKAARRAEKWKRAGFALYPVGLLIGLFGKFLKSDDDDLEVDSA